MRVGIPRALPTWFASLVTVASERKLVTVLFCDLVGSTALAERLDAESIQSVQRAYFDRMRTVIEHFGGTVEKFAGDAVVAVFGVPTLHEDDAERAVRCALEMHQALLGLSDTLRPRFGIDLAFRTGVQTGEAFVSSGTDALATGDVMNTAARIEQHASPGQILVGHETVVLTADVVEYGDEIRLEAKGKTDPVRARPALRLHARRTRARSPLVGRGRELEILAGALERAIAKTEPQAVLVVGEPGIGKSRLVEEFSARLNGRATVLRGACLPYGEGSTWRPFEEIVRHDAGIVAGDDDDGQALGKLEATLRGRHPGDELTLVIAQLAPLAGVTTATITSEQELRWALGRYLRSIASAGPVVLVLDDLHWGDDALLEAALELLETVSTAPLVVVLQGRPELLERLPELHRDDRAEVIRLGGLSPRESATLVDNLADAFGTRWAGEVRDAVVDRGDGSPLFLEEVAAMAREEGLRGGVPRSLRALIAARLDLLPPDAKRAAQVAAVVADVFSEDDIAELAAREPVLPAIRQLESRGFVVEQLEGSPGTSGQFAFRHALVREVIYLSLAKLDRAELHRRAVALLDSRVGQRPEVILAIAHHLERAVVLRREVFPAEETEPALVEAAVDALRSGATWVGANAGTRESIELLRRAISIAEGDRKLTELANAQLAAMLARSGSAESADLARDILKAPAAPEAAAFASLALAEDARSRADAAAMAEAGTRALELARSAGLPAVEIEALDIVGLAEAWGGRLSSSIERRQRAIKLALDLGDLPRAAWGMAGYHAIGLLGLGKVGEAERHALEAMRLATQSGSLRGLESVHAALGFVRRAQDRLDEAVTHGRERFRLAQDLGEPLWIYNSLTISLARPFIDLGLLDEAWQCLDRALTISAEPGSGFESGARAQRVAVLLAWGRLDEAAAEAELVDSISQPYEEIAELRAAQGLENEADEIWQRALEPTATSENLLDGAETVVGYARFLARCGRRDEARTRLSEAKAAIQGTELDFVKRLIREAEAHLDSSL
jgi:class 3 adenylate cyclase/tetratricopeptide (TPR) repeat protein